MKKLNWFLLSLLCSCAGQVLNDPLPAECIPPGGLVCTHDQELSREVCEAPNADHWVFYPSGELWHFKDPDGRTDSVFCHVLPDGRVVRL